MVRLWLCFLLALPVFSASTTAAGWIRVRSQHFEVYSSAGAPATKETVRHFEQARNFFGRAMGSRDLPSGLVRIVAFGSEKEFEPYRVNEFATAYYMGGSEQDTIVMSRAGKDAFPMALHEYAHLVIRHAGWTLPLWLNEGMAEFYSNIQFKSSRRRGGLAQLGGSIDGRSAALRRGGWVPLSEIVGADVSSAYYNEKERAGSFYNQSWALTHMLLMTDSYRHNFPQFLEKLQGGLTTELALTKIYGKPLADVERELRDYIHSGDYPTETYRFDEFGKAETEVEPAPEFELNLALTQAANQPGREFEIRKRLRALAAEAPERPEPHLQSGYLEWKADGLIVEVDPTRAQRRLEMGYVDMVVDTLEEAMTLVEEYKNNGQPKSIGLIGNAAEIYPELAMRGVVPDVVTDQTPAHDVLMYVPAGLDVRAADDLRVNKPAEYHQRSMQSMARHVQAMLEFKRHGSEVFDYGNNLRQRAFDEGVKDAFEFPGFVPAYIRPLFCEGKGPFRWVALSGDPEDIYRTDEAIAELFPEDAHLHRWLKMAREKVHFQGLPARICWLGYGERAEAGLPFNNLVADGIVKAPIVIGRDHLDTGSAASPNRETEGMLDGRDAVSDWAILNALINAVGGATWVSFHHGGGVGLASASMPVR